MALPASHLALTPEPGFTHQWVGNSPGVLWTLAMPTSEPALAPGPMGLCSQLPWDQAPLMNRWHLIKLSGGYDEIYCLRNTVLCNYHCYHREELFIHGFLHKNPVWGHL